MWEPDCRHLHVGHDAALRRKCDARMKAKHLESTSAVAIQKSRSDLEPIMNNVRGSTLLHEQYISYHVTSSKLDLASLTSF